MKIRAQKLFGPHLNHKHSPIEPKKARKNNQIIKKSQKTETLENESYQSTLVNPKKLLRPNPVPPKKYSDTAPKG